MYVFFDFQFWFCYEKLTYSPFCTSTTPTSCTPLDLNDRFTEQTQTNQQKKTKLNTNADLLANYGTQFDRQRNQKGYTWHIFTLCQFVIFDAPHRYNWWIFIIECQCTFIRDWYLHLDTRSWHTQPNQINRRRAIVFFVVVAIATAWLWLLFLLFRFHQFICLKFKFITFDIFEW